MGRRLDSLSCVFQFGHCTAELRLRKERKFYERKCHSFGGKICHFISPPGHPPPPPQYRPLFFDLLTNKSNGMAFDVITTCAPSVRISRGWCTSVTFFFFLRRADQGLLSNMISSVSVFLTLFCTSHFCLFFFIFLFFL